MQGEHRDLFLPGSRLEISHINLEIRHLEKPPAKFSPLLRMWPCQLIRITTEFYETAPGQVETWVTIPEHYQGYPGIVHGGIVAAVLDETAGRVHMGTGDTPRFMFTARLEVRYRKNVPTGQPIRVVGQAGPSKRRSAAASSSIYDQEGSLLAEADAVLVDVPQDAIAGVDLEALGWKVYPED